MGLRNGASKTDQRSYDLVNEKRGSLTEQHHSNAGDCYILIMAQYKTILGCKAAAFSYNRAGSKSKVSIQWSDTFSERKMHCNAWCES